MARYMVVKIYTDGTFKVEDEKGMAIPPRPIENPDDPIKEILDFHGHDSIKGGYHSLTVFTGHSPGCVCKRIGNNWYQICD